MDKTNTLIIRACKSKDPHKRLESIYRRFWRADKSYTMLVMTNRIAHLCDEYDLISLERFISDYLNSYARVMNEFKDNELLYSTLINTIRYTESKYFGENFPWPAWSRRLRSQVIDLEIKKESLLSGS